MPGFGLPRCENEDRHCGGKTWSELSSNRRDSEWLAHWNVPVSRNAPKTAGTEPLTRSLLLGSMMVCRNHATQQGEQCNELAAALDSAPGTIPLFASASVCRRLSGSSPAPKERQHVPQAPLHFLATLNVACGRQVCSIRPSTPNGRNAGRPEVPLSQRKTGPGQDLRR